MAVTQKTSNFETFGMHFLRSVNLTLQNIYHINWLTVTMLKTSCDVEIISIFKISQKFITTPKKRFANIRSPQVALLFNQKRRDGGANLRNTTSK